MLLATLVVIVTLTIDGEPSFEADDLLVISPLGKFRGNYTNADKSAVGFLGIRYATMPSRFQRSVSNTHTHEGVQDATSYGAECAQYSSAGTFSGVEDCLFLNLMRPASIQSKKKLLPVMLWVHGGGFRFGAGSDPLFNGAKVVGKHDVILVTINYRIGPLGFLVTDATGKGGMNGILDMVTALQFMQGILRSFGGDPNRVTVFGESAGGQATCVLSVLPAAKGLLRASITQSGPCVGPWGPQSTARGRADAAALVAQAGVGSVQDLAKAPVQQVSRWATGTETNGYYQDTNLFTKPTGKYFAGSRVDLNVEAMVIGSTSYDGTAWLDLPEVTAAETADTAANRAKYATLASALWGDARRAHNVDSAETSTGRAPCSAPPVAGAASTSVTAQYAMTDQERYAPPNMLAALVQSDSDYAVTCPSLGIAAAAADAAKVGGGVPVFEYQFAYLHEKCDGTWLFSSAGPLPGQNPPPTAAANPRWASHGSELPFVFGNDMMIAPTRCPFNSTEQQLVDVMMASWVSFATSLDPNPTKTSSVMSRWEKLDASAPAAMVFTLPISQSKMTAATQLGVNAQRARCTYFGSYCTQT